MAAGFLFGTTKRETNYHEGVKDVVVVVVVRCIVSDYHSAIPLCVNRGPTRICFSKKKCYNKYDPL